MPSENLKKWMPFWHKLEDTNGNAVREGFAMFREDLIRNHVKRKGSAEGLNLKGVTLTGLPVAETSFAGCNMDDAVAGPILPITRYMIERLDTNYQPSGTFPSMPIMEGVDYASLENAQMQNVSLRNARLNLVNARGADLRGANMAGAEIVAADFTGALLDGADFNGVKLDVRTKFSAGGLRGVKNLDKAIIVDERGREIAGMRLTTRGIERPHGPAMG